MRDRHGRIGQIRAELQDIIGQFGVPAAAKAPAARPTARSAPVTSVRTDNLQPGGQTSEQVNTKSDPVPARRDAHDLVARRRAKKTVAPVAASTQVSPPAKAVVPSRTWRLGVVTGVAALILISCTLAVRHLASLPQGDAARSRIPHLLARMFTAPAPHAERKTAVAEPPAATKPPAAAALPDTYGIFALADGQLTALDVLPVRVPDPRVYVSATFSKAAPAAISSGHLTFIAYHREFAKSVPETASVRIIARVVRSQMPGEKPRLIDDQWAVRGGAIDFRIAPVRDNPEMITLRPADPDLTLAPGRYALMFRNQAYDFVVAGADNDPAHCLEKTEVLGQPTLTECRGAAPSAAGL